MTEDYEDDDYDDYEEDFTQDYDHVGGGMDDSENVNVPLLLEELRHVTIFPEQHDQGVYAMVDQEDKPESACGSFACLAGNTVIHKDIPLKWYRWQRSYWDKGELKSQYYWRADYILDENGGDEKTIHNEARDILGLNSVQASMLFDGSNSLRDLWTYGIEISGGQITWEDYDQAEKEYNMRRILRVNDGGTVV